MQYAKSFLKLLIEVFGSGGNIEEAWVDSDISLSPREKLVGQVSRVMQWAAISNGLILLMAMLAIWFELIAAADMSPWWFTSPILSADMLTLIGLMIMAGNITLFLLLSASTGAQEFWGMLLLLVAVLWNGGLLIMFRFYPAILALIPMFYGAYLMTHDWRAFHLNSVAVKELRGRMRGVRSFAIITVFLVMMGSFVVLLYLMQLPALQASDVIITGNLGQILFFGVVGIELMLIVFIVPALTSGSITGERERKTYDLLQTTLLSAPTFIVGKMESALGYIALLLLSAIPLQSVAFLFGGVSITEVGITFVLLASTALLLGALGMFFSAMTERTMTSTIRVYTIAVGIVFGLPLVSLLFFKGAFVDAVIGIPSDAPAIYSDMLWGSLNPITSAFYSQQMLVSQQDIGVLNIELANNTFIPIVAPWILTTIIYIGATAFLLLLAIRRMRRSG
jgi:hypothetical protein